MKMLLFIGAFYCFLGLGPQAFSVASTNFSGTWIRDKNKVEGMKAPLPDLTWIITQDINQFSIEAVGSFKSTPKEIYMLDGTQTVTETTSSHPPKKITRSAKWLNDGQILELTTLSVSRGDSITKSTTLIVKDRLELGEDGNILKVRRTVNIPDIAAALSIQEIRFTFYKKKP